MNCIKPLRVWILLICGWMGMVSPMFAQLIYHEKLISFEDEIDPTWLQAKGGSLARSGKHFKDGEYSLEWTYNGGGEVRMMRPVGYEEKDPSGKDLYRSAYVVWVYNEVAQEGCLKFEYLKNGKECCGFDFQLDFTGWRAAWVSFDRDMKGQPVLGMDEMRVVAPKKAGKVYLDHIVTATKMDQRYQAPDRQVPQVNAETKSHWLMIYHYSKLQAGEVEKMSEDEMDGWEKEIETIESRFRKMILKKVKLSEPEMVEIRRMYQHYRIERDGDQIRGLPIFYGRAVEAYERLVPEWKTVMNGKNMEVGAYFQLMSRIAAAYHGAESVEWIEELERMYLMMFDHMVDQGIADGSCLGNITHYGYSFRELYPACFLMMDVLAKSGRLDKAQRLMQWYAMTQVIFEKVEEPGIDMDAFNTQTTGRMASILMIADLPRKVQYMKAYSKWIENGCMPAKGLMGAFKVDGAAFHHCNLYPAYAVGGLEGASRMIYLLSRTPFAVSAEAHETVKRVLLGMRFYCQTRHFPLALSGRHPDGKGRLIAMQYATMAEAGTPGGKEVVDREMAAAFLRLVSLGLKDGREDPEYLPMATREQERAMAEKFKGLGMVAETEPQGNLAMGYGCLSVQRRGNWAAVAKGHSRYLWAAEHYMTNNYYGRYLAHGSLQILSGPVGEQVTPRTSGWQEEGFDWNRIPGVTSVHLPYELLKARVLNVDEYSGFEEMLYSDEAFAGGLSHRGRDGNFAMKLHEHDKYEGSLRARKSYHFVDGVVVALGSEVECAQTAWPTETTVAQTWVSEERLAEWRERKMEGVKWMDPCGNGYYLPSGARYEVHFPQESYGQNTGAATSGNWVSVVIDHGKAPKGAGYEYAVLPQCRVEELEAMAANPSYQVLQRDRVAHIVDFPSKRMRSYAFFERPEQELAEGIVRAVDQSCLVMAEMVSDEAAVVTVTQPDLGLYEGPSDEARDEQGKRKERSVYSRPWIHAESRVIRVEVSLRGEWDVDERDGQRVVHQDHDKTVISIACKDGVSREVKAKRRKRNLKSES